MGKLPNPNRWVMGPTHSSLYLDAQIQHAESNMPQIHRRRTRSGQLIPLRPTSPNAGSLAVFQDDDEDMIDLYGDDHDDDFVVPSRGKVTHGAWSGPARPELSSNGSGSKDSKGKGESWDQWYDALEGSAKLGDVPSYITPGKFPFRASTRIWRNDPDLRKGE